MTRPPVELLHHDQQQLLLRAEMVEHGGRGDAGPLGHRRHARALESTAGEQLDRCVHDGAPPLLAPPLNLALDPGHAVESPFP
jgi:hypothetical protein